MATDILKKGHRVNPDVTYSNYRVLSNGRVEFALTKEQKRLLTDIFYGQFHGTIGLTKLWHAMKDVRGRPTFRAMQQWYKAQLVKGDGLTF